MRVLIIPEDPTLDQHVIKPIIEGIFADLKRPARVDVLTNPHLHSISQALNPTTVSDIIADNPMIDLFVLAIDRDCDRLGATEKAATRVAEHPGKLIAVLAWQEVEVWALALHREKLGVPWSQVRAACDPKEAYWDPFIAQSGWLSEVGKGRKKAMRALSGQWAGLLSVCPEIAELRERLRAQLSA